MAEAAAKTPPRGAQPETDYDWLELTDFSPGCYDYSSIAGSEPNVPGPQHAADATKTFACIALPNGGLGPLPGVGASYTWTEIHGTLPTINYVTGLLVHDEVGQDEALVMCEFDDGSNHHFVFDSFLPNSSAFTNLEATTNPSGGLNEFPFGSPYPQMTRAADTNPTTSVGTPVCVFPVASFAYPNATAGQIFMYPDPAAPTTPSARKLITDGAPQSESGMILVHQSRVIVLANTGQDWPITGAGSWVVNETINYTDPPNSDIYPASSVPGQQTIAVAEEPYGYGCGGSISAGELFLVKRRGGGVLIQGDIFAPTITFLPGVQPTGQGYGNADSGQGGLAYCSIDEGAWIWNGSNTSEKISQNLDDSFFHVPDAAIYLSWYVKWVGDKLYFSNNWMLDTRTNSWWRYYPDSTQGGRDLFWVQPVNGPTIYCSPLVFDTSDLTWLYRFDLDLPTELWQWHSLPIRQSINRFVEARRIIVRATSNSGNTGAQVKVEIFNGTTSVGSVTTPSGQIGEAPTMISMPIGSVNAAGHPYSSEDLTVRITGIGNSAAAPNVHSVSIGFTKRAQAPTVGVSS